MSRPPIGPVWGLVEIAVSGGLFVVALWVAGPTVGSNPAATLTYWFVIVALVLEVAWVSPLLLHLDPPELRGWGLPRSPADPGAVRNAWPAYAIYTAGAAAALIAGAAMHDQAFAGHVHWELMGRKFLIYLVWGLVQAAVIFSFVQTRLRAAASQLIADDRTRRLAVVFATAGLFALAHAPNWPLAAMVFAVGLGWSWLYYARPSLALVAVSHAVLGTLVYGVLHLFTRVGPFYDHPEGHLVRSAVPGLKAIVGDLF